MLIGTRANGRFEVQRALPCPNLAGSARGGPVARIDPRAIENVRRTLANTPWRIVGFYHTAGVPVLDAWSPEQVSANPDLMWLGIIGFELPPSAAWWDSDPRSARELAIEITTPSAAAVVCPE